MATTDGAAYTRVFGWGRLFCRYVHIVLYNFKH